MVIHGGAEKVVGMVAKFAKLQLLPEDIALLSSMLEPMYFKRATVASIFRSHLLAPVS